MAECIYCHATDFGRPCLDSPDGHHWTWRDKAQQLAAEVEASRAHMRDANRLLLQAAAIARVLSMPRRRDRRRALRELPSRPDAMDFECAAAKISDTMAVWAGDRSLPVGPTFDALEGRAPRDPGKPGH